MRYRKSVVAALIASISTPDVASFTPFTSLSSAQRNRISLFPVSTSDGGVSGLTSISATVVNGETAVINTTDEDSNIEENIRLSVFERARTVTYICRSGTLCTISQSDGIEGSPFGSFVDYVLDADGNPVFLMNELSMHTTNIQQGPKESMVTLFTQLKSTGLDSRGQDVSRCSITGVIEMCDDNNFPDRDQIRLQYSITHAYADRVMDSPKFQFYRLRPSKIYFVSGFGVTSSWVPVEEYQSASPDILAREASEIILKLNREHTEDLEFVGSHLLGLTNVQDIQVTNVDRLGLDLRITRQQTRMKLITEEFRLGFRIPVYSVEDAKSEVMKIFQEAWEKGQGLDWGDDDDDDDSVPIIKTAVQSLD